MQILIVDDNPADAELNQLALRSMKDLTFDTVESFDQCKEIFGPGKYGAVISDYNLGGSLGSDVLKFVHELEPDIPFILISGALGEELAVEMLRKGATDYVLKNSLEKLPLVLARALREADAIRQSKDANTLLRESEEKFKAIASYTANWESWFSPEGKLLWVNPGVERVIGYTNEELLAMPNFVETIIYKDDLAIVSQKLHAGLVDKVEEENVEFRCNHKDGSVRWFSVSSKQVYDSAGKSMGLRTSGMNINDLIQKQLEVKQSEERFRKIFNSIGDVYYQTDRDGIYTMISPSCFQVTGYKSKELMGHHAEILYANPELRKMLLALLKQEKRINNHEIKIKHKNGDVILISANINLLLNENNEPIGTQGIYRDITEKKKKDEELFLAEAATRTKSQFLANMSHEIRTPLNAIIGLSHLALETNLSTKQLDYLTKIESSSESLLGIINDILDFSKIESGKLSMEEIEFDLEDVMGKMSDVVTYKAQQKGIEIIFGMDVYTPTHLVGDPTRLGQILNNLATNAIKFTDQGETAIQVKTLEENKEKVKLQFSVRDTGIGIRKEQIEKLFTPFTQAEDSITRHHGGTGLGLSIAKHLVTMMSGDIWVESEPGKGSCFFFTIWLKKQSEQFNKFTFPQELGKICVLLVDDNETAHNVIRETLLAFSFDVVSARSGKQAIEILKQESSNPVQVVLMDSEMEEMDGVETVHLIRADAQIAAIPIIMTCAGYASQDVVLLAEDLNFSGILVKPIRHSVLFDTLIGVFAKGPKHKKKKKQIKSIKGLHHHTILLVEDHEINQQVASELLKGFGFKIELAENGLEAFNAIKNSGTPSKYSLVLMDLQMPVMGGFAATQEIRKIDSYKSLPIVAMTADAMGGVKERCLEVGMVDFISKPINPKSMLETILKWIVIGDPSEQLDQVAMPEDAKQEEIIIPRMVGVDIDDGLSHVAGNTRLYYDLLVKFRDNHQTFITELKKAIESNRLEESKHLIHTLKGLSGNLGLIDLHKICISTEQNSHDLTYAQFDDKIKPLSDELNVVLTSLQKNLKKEIAVPSISKNEALPLLAHLSKFLRDQNPEAVNMIKKIGVVEGFEKEMEKLAKAVKSYDFDAALEILKENKLLIK